MRRAGPRHSVQTGGLVVTGVHGWCAGEGEDGFGLPPETLLLAVVPPFTLGKVGGLAGLVLRHLVLGVLLALLAVHLLLLGSAHHVYKFICLKKLRERG